METVSKVKLETKTLAMRLALGIISTAYHFRLLSLDRAIRLAESSALLAKYRINGGQWRLFDKPQIQRPDV